MITPQSSFEGVFVRIKLTKEQCEAAKFSGISEETYAQNLLRLIDEKLEESVYLHDHRGYR